jgi:hypothetical protein
VLIRVWPKIVLASRAGTPRSLSQRADRVPDVVDLDEADLVVIADAPEGADEVARFDRPPGPRGEHEPGFRPSSAHVDAVGGLPLGLELERPSGYVQQRTSCWTVPSLSRASARVLP